MDAALVAAIADIEIAGAVDLHAVGRGLAVGLDLGPDGAAREQPVGLDVEDAHMAAVGVVDEQPLFVAGETEAVGLAEIVGQEGEAGAVIAHPVDAAERQLGRPARGRNPGVGYRRDR